MESEFRLKTKIAAVALMAAGVVALPVGAAFAAGGYGPSAPTGPAGAPGGYTSVVVSQAVTSSGGMVAAAVPGATLSAVVPAGTFSQPVQMEVTAPSLSGIQTALAGAGFSGYTAVSGVGVKVLDSNGQPLAGTFAHPVTVTLRGSGLGVPGERVLELTGSGTATVLSSTVSVGEVTFTLNADPDLVVVNPAASSASTVLGATAQNTGLPFNGETDVAAGLAVLGVLALGGAAQRKLALARR